MAPLKRKADAIDTDVNARNKQYQINRNAARQRKRKGECTFRLWMPPQQPAQRPLTPPTTPPQIPQQLAFTPARLHVHEDARIEEAERVENALASPHYPPSPDTDEPEDTGTPEFSFMHELLPSPVNEELEPGWAMPTRELSSLPGGRQDASPLPLAEEQQQPHAGARASTVEASPLPPEPLPNEDETEDAAEQTIDIELLNAQEKAIHVLNAMFSTMSCNSSKYIYALFTTGC